MSNLKRLNRRGLLCGMTLATGYRWREFRSSLTATATQIEPVAIRILAPDIAMKRTVGSVRDRFVAETGIEVTFTFTPAENVLFAMREDARVGNDQIDGAIVPMWHIGDLLTDNLILPLDQFYNSTESTFPRHELADEFPAVRLLRRFDGDLVAMPLDADCMLLFYRTDLLADPRHQRDYEAFANASLQVPETWEDLLTIGSYFKSIGINATPLHLKDAGLGVFQYLALAAPFVASAASPESFWFDPVSFQPQLATDGHIEALMMFKRLFDLGPSAQLSWTLAAAWNHFLQGQSVFALAWPDLLTTSINYDYDFRDVIGVAQIPGIPAVPGLPNGRDNSAGSVHRVGNALGACWGGVVRGSSERPEAVYHFFSLLAEESLQRTFGWRVDDGIDPGRISQMPSEVLEGGATAIDNYAGAGFAYEQALQFTDSVSQTLMNPLQLPYLRIPGAFDYLSALDSRLHEFLASVDLQPPQALELAEEDFAEITAQHGIERQRKLYLQSLK